MDGGRRTEDGQIHITKYVQRLISVSRYKLQALANLRYGSYNKSFYSIFNLFWCFRRMMNLFYLWIFSLIFGRRKKYVTCQIVKNETETICGEKQKWIVLIYHSSKEFPLSRHSFLGNQNQFHQVRLGVVLLWFSLWLSNCVLVIFFFSPLSSRCYQLSLLHRCR